MSSHPTTCIMLAVWGILQLHNAMAENHAVLTNEDIQLKLKRLEENDVQLQQRITNLEVENIGLKDKLKRSEGNRMKTENWIGFTAYATEYRDYSSGETIQYDGVITNIGSLYNPTTSIFRCSHSGYYLFTLTNKGSSGHFVDAEMVAGDRVVAYTYCSDGSDSASNIALVHCEKDEEVFVRAADGGRLVGLEKPESTFSGTLLSLA